MADLTAEAKAAIADAVRIVKEDKFYAYAKTTLGKHANNPANPGVDPPTPKTGDPSTDPPAPPVTDPPAETNKSRYWGELFNE